MIRVFPAGAFQNRQPLAYAPIRDRAADCITLVDTPEAAQIVTIHHPMDLDLSGRRLRQMTKARPDLRVVLLSEEPFWDTAWGRDPFCRQNLHDTAEGPLPYTVISHQTSGLYRANRIPYFLLTDPRYIAHYRPLFDRNAGMRVSDWLAHFRQAEYDAAFIGEKRLHDRDRVTFAAEDVWGLSHFRTRMALLCTRGRVLRAGKGWAPGPARQDLPDWHADKLNRLDLRCRHVAAFENTHQADYVSEKLFDAFAVGGVPLYFAGPGHAAHRLAGRGWLNFYARPPRAEIFDPRRPVTLAEAEVYARMQDGLAQLFADPAAVSAELDRLVAALHRELAAVLAGPATSPAP